MVVTRVRREVSSSAVDLAVGALGQLVLLLLLWHHAGLGVLGLSVGVGYAATVLVLLLQAFRLRARWGPADRVTLVRTSLVGGVTALVADASGAPAVTGPLVGLAVVALVLDAVDGYVARRTGTACHPGARFDMEVDAFLILVLSVFVAQILGWWVLAIGALRYVFAVAGYAACWLRAPLPPSSARKTVAALQGILLTAVSTGLLPRPAAAMLIVLALCSLLWSFGRDTWWLWRNRHSSAP